MKKIILFVSLLAPVFSIHAIAQDLLNPPADKATQEEKKLSNAVIKFDSLEHDYGTIKNGANGVYEFKFTNEGTDPLIISNAHGSCGCTVPEWPKEPILPGKANKIKVSYDTKRTGPFTKTVTLNSNAKNETVVLTIKGTIEAPVKEETMPLKKVEDGATPFATPSNKSK